MFFNETPMYKTAVRLIIQLHAAFASVTKGAEVKIDADRLPRGTCGRETARLHGNETLGWWVWVEERLLDGPISALWYS